MAKTDNKEKKTSLKDKGLNLDYKMTGNPFVDNKRVQQMTLGDLPSARGIDTESYKDYMDINKVNIFEQDIDKIRAQNQSGWAQAANAAFGGVGKGLLTAAESASYLLDFDNHVKSIQGLDTWEKNWLAEAAGKGKEAIDESLPIYRENPEEVFDLDDPAFYWGSIQGILDSAVGFGLPGGAIAKGVGLGMKALRVSKLVDLMSKGSGVAGQVTNALASGVVQNYAEGKVMGIETYENTLKDLTPLIQEGKLTDAKAKEIAGEAANEMLLNNRAMILSDAFSLYGLTKGVGSIRNIIKQRGFKNRFKDFGKSLVAPNADNLILQGGKEAAEEIAQNVIQMEAQFGAKVKAGMDVSNVPSGALERALSFATSDQALLEGMMGFFGGGPQRILSEATTGNLGKKAVERHNTRYKNQQALIKENEELLSSLMKKSKEVTATKDLLNKKGRTADADLIADMDFAGLSSRNFTMGTTEQLENSLKELAAGNATEEQMANLPEDFQKQAQQKLERLAEFEKLWLKHSDKANVSELFTNTVKQENINKAVEINDQKQAEVSSDLMKEIETSIIPRIKFTNSDIENVTFSLDDGGTIDVTFKGEINNKQKEADIKKDFKESLEQLNSYEKLEKLKKDAEVNAVFAGITAEELNQASTEKGEKAFTERVAKSQQKKKAAENPDIDEQTIREDAEYEAASASKLDELLKEYEANPAALSENDRAVVEAYKDQKENGTATPAVDKLKARRNAKKNKDPKKQPAPAEDPTDAEIKVANELKESDEEDGVVKLTKETALAWKSADNYGDNSDANKALTDFLENWMMSVEDIDVVYEVDKDIINSGNIPEYNKFKALIIEEEGKEKDLSLPPLNEIGKVPVIAKLYRNGEPIVHQGHELSMYLHDDTHSFHEKIKETAVNNVREHKTQIVTAHIEGKKLKSKMLEKSNGHINVSLDDNGDYKQNQVSDVLGNLEDVEFLYGDAEGFYRNSEKEESDKIDYLSATPGAIYAVTRTANGTEFPLRLYSSKITNSEAELVYELYLAAMSNDDAYASGLSPELKKLIKESDNERISGIQNIVNLNQISVKDLVSSVVYQGYSSTSEKEGSKLYYSKGNEYGSDMQFGKTKMKLKEFQSEEGKQQFLDWITINRKRQVDAESLSDIKYKNFINNNKVVTTNVEKTAGGKLFVQPTVTYSPELESFSKPENTGTSKKDRENSFRQSRRGGGQPAQASEVEVKFLPVDMSNYGKSYKQEDISEGGKNIIFNPYHQVVKINNGILTASIDDINGKTFYPISVDVSNTPEYLDYKSKKDILDNERKRLRKEGEKGIESMLRGMEAFVSVAKKKLNGPTT